MTTSTGADDQIACVEVSFRPNVKLIPMVRKFVSDFYAQLFSDADAVSRIGLATHELLENAVRYSTDGHSKIWIEVARAPGANRLTIRTWNRAAPNNLDVVRKAFDEMNRDADPFGHYQSVIRRSAKITGRSGLGLARVRAEAEMRLSYELEPDNLLRIQAEADVQLRSPV